MDEVFGSFKIEESVGNRDTLDDPLAEAVRRVLYALLDHVHLFEQGRSIFPDSFSFIGYEADGPYPILASGKKETND